ncbi:hypothetical protein EYZ11_012023 [Aspergillus tanneri]|uniref:CBF1-interacting co-repressor CIR N-terminal domain-containing protein n=1 Tax=Aspergillus tanneri TaxID=1220188 RepID=A0A4S3J1A6_9EURO|nr:hypothetical protein EYZ11_012023 [Aspergillus tanneri]
MPLHLLGKKSWNVYNPENIARVRRDEVQAKAREEEQERRMQEVDAERRIQILRGERPSSPPPPPSPLLPVVRSDRKPHATDIGRTRKRRRLAGENDTDRDIRFAREDAQLALAKRGELATTRTSDAPLHDSAGHINLFPSEETQRSAVKNAEAEKESADLQRKYEDQYTMRFSNAAGFRQSVGQTPWYSASGSDAMAPDPVSGKDVWGNEDPMRRERERVRMDADDPLGAMRKGTRIEGRIVTVNMVVIGVGIGHIGEKMIQNRALIAMIATATAGVTIDGIVQMIHKRRSSRDNDRSLL